MTARNEAVTFPEATLRAGDLTLRPLADADTDDVTMACQDSETLRWLPLPQPYTRASAEWFIGTFGPSQRESGAGIVFAIESAGRLAGAIDLKHVNWASKTGNVASQGVAQKAGFVREGVVRNAGYVHDGRVDLVLFSLIPDDLQRQMS